MTSSLQQEVVPCYRRCEAPTEPAPNERVDLGAMEPMKATLKFHKDGQ